MIFCHIYIVIIITVISAVNGLRLVVCILQVHILMHTRLTSIDVNSGVTSPDDVYGILLQPADLSEQISLTSRYVHDVMWFDLPASVHAVVCVAVII